jgi:hypothetical protein
MYGHTDIISKWLPVRVLHFTPLLLQPVNGFGELYNEWNNWLMRSIRSRSATN